AGFTITPAPTFTPAPSTPTYIYSKEGYGDISAIAWSPDGSTLATLDGQNIRVWDTTTGKQLQRLVSDSGLVEAAWSPDGRVLASLDAEAYPPKDTTVKLWDPAGGKQLRTLALQ